MEQSYIIQCLDKLALKDKKLKEAIEWVGYPAPRDHPRGFWTLLVTIANQQISVEAGRAILGRIEQLMPAKSAQSFLDLAEDQLRGAGLSRPKIRYATGIAEAFLRGEFEDHLLDPMDDEELLTQLTTLKGIGRWTAEIYAMSAMGRMDMFPADDVALQEAMRRLLKKKERPKPKEARKLAEKWHPYRTVMSIFLWHYYRGAPDDKTSTDK